jgi:GAF domain-containing protein
MHNLELFEVQHTEGPCLDVLRSGQAVVNAPIPENTRWPLFAAEAHAAGYKTVHALPMRHNGRVIGVVNLFDDKSAMLDKTRIRVVQALADIASFAVLQTRALDEATSLTSPPGQARSGRLPLARVRGCRAGPGRPDGHGPAPAGALLSARGPHVLRPARRDP